MNVTIISLDLESHHKKAKNRRRRLQAINRAALLRKSRHIRGRDIYRRAKIRALLDKRTFAGRGGVSRG